MENAHPVENPQQEAVKSHRLMGTFLTLISAASFGFMAIFIKYAYLAKLNTITILSLRFLIAALVMWLVVAIKKENPRLSVKQMLALAGLGALGYGAMSSFFFNSVRLIPASIASIMLYTYPVIVTVLSAWIYRESITRYKVLALVISSAGLVMVVGIAFEGLNYLGVFFGGMAAVVYSLYLIICNKLVGTVSPIVMTAYVSTSAAVAFSILGWATGDVNMAISTQGWLAILGIAVISTALAIMTLFQGMKLVGPSRASIISTVEPVITICAAFLLLSEKLSLFQVIGAGLVISAVVLIQKDS